MAKKKIQREVEEKGLDPTVPHRLLGQDGRLLVASSEPTIFQDIAESVELTEVDSANSAFVVFSNRIENTENVELAEPITPPVAPAAKPGKRGRSKQTTARSE